ncbi:MAG: DUF6165 family protein [Desulfovermiculus sp.]|nr:DUF6165 family protein [Desulfovermiculus sp.]
MLVDISIGELVDKVSILKIKSCKIQDPKKLKNIHHELKLLSRKMESTGITVESSGYRKLEKINTALWDIEDRIRMKEAKKAFDDEFIQLARSVYLQNDERAAVKREINTAYGSNLIEEKSYASYT